jgi:uncharacterized protein (TIGR00375 family)
VGTGDFTHPRWLAELKDKLDPAEPGLFKLKRGMNMPTALPAPFSRAPVRFMLTAELSSIYKKNNKTRKVHNLIFAPDFEVVENFQKKLSGLGYNITSDGRPVMGMDSRNLLELSLELSRQILFVPAHIWTPWFSVLGAKSGFDSITECFEDLAPHIYAVETGLSSDPPMNRLCSFLDPYTMISNSDAHSPEKLGREASIFNTDVSYDRIISAIRSKKYPEYSGTIEMFPQEGKYYFDGHRKCGIRWNPAAPTPDDGICPVCGKKITKGVLNRIMCLADRTVPAADGDFSCYSVISLKNLVADILGKGPQSKAVQAAYRKMIQSAGPELHILLESSEEDLQKLNFPELVSGIVRMRKKDITMEEGFDGEYGKISV